MSTNNISFYGEIWKIIPKLLLILTQRIYIGSGKELCFVLQLEGDANCRCCRKFYDVIPRFLDCVTSIHVSKM